MNIYLQLALSWLMSVYAVHWIFLKILKVAKVKGLVDNPDARKLQKTPVPVLGGIAVFFGLLFGILTFASTAIVSRGWDVDVLTQGSQLIGIGPVLMGASIMLYVGALDDIMGLTPRARLVIEMLVMLGVIYGSGMCVDSFHGLWGVGKFSWWIGVPLTVFAGVGIINAYNMVDGVNGLSSGLCMACSVIFGVIFVKRGDVSNAALAFCFAGALVPFYVHNVFGSRSKMFIGDAGTMVMGLLVSWFIIRMLSSKNAETVTALAGEGRVLCVVAMMLAVASVPVFDTLRVMTARVMRGVSPFSADKTHLHHAFIASGVSHLITGLSELLLNLLVVAVWYAVYRAGCCQECQLYVTIGAAVLLVWGTYVFLHYQQKHNTKAFRKFNEMSRVTHLGDKRWWKALQMWLDKGAYEDYFITYKEKLNKKPEDMNNKEKDQLAIVKYLTGKESVNVEDIVKESGADPMRVYPILFEMEQDHVLEVVKREPLGAARVVKLLL
ncbi:MAG: undecaprenyl/decaprenyl-phosphate alpha-N-acetylglucosaminyl 1-phosphate transferase [Bacteroidales bacterium]|nr:undecaprenyl/decaprenyl-phosphate alpha-N-acetylglucosaminyl 1-phosphate transferase [Bacteroidales bacterium]